MISFEIIIDEILQEESSMINVKDLEESVVD